MKTLAVNVLPVGPLSCAKALPPAACMFFMAKVVCPQWASLAMSLRGQAARERSFLRGLLVAARSRAGVVEHRLGSRRQADGADTTQDGGWLRGGGNALHLP